MGVNFAKPAAVAAAALLAVGACAPKPPPAKKAVNTVVPDCYTVELFHPEKIRKPSARIPESWAAFSGKWGKGAWGGKWCHDLHVISISDSGVVDLFELHAPYEPWNKPATAFRRKGRMTEDGRLRIFYTGVTVEYRMKNGRMMGKRRENGVEQRIVLSPLGDA